MTQAPQPVTLTERGSDAITKTPGTVVVFAGIDGALTPAAKAANTAMQDAIGRLMKSGRFDGKLHETIEIAAPHGVEAERVIVAGTGGEALSQSDAQKIGGKIGAALGRVDDKGATIFAEGLGNAQIAAAIAHGATLRRYTFNQYKTKSDKGDKGHGSVTVALPALDGAEAIAAEMNALAEGVFFARDLINEPANVLYPEAFAARLEAMREIGLAVTTLAEDEMEALGMGALLGVAQGSEFGARLVVMKWTNAPDPKAAPVCFVGKGVTFDTGGISIKPAGGMEEMTMDMGGAAVVSGVMKALARGNAPVNAVGVVGLVENMPDGKAQRPGDIVTSMSGQTIEIINTDAEGRLVLADALYYAQREFKPAATIDLATLTGAIIIALGHENAGFFANDDDLAAQLNASAKATDEGLWRLPLAQAYDDQLKSRLADMKNVGGRPAGSITAAQFLQRFVDESPWAHIDIAGMALGKEDKPTCPKGGTGYGVATLVHLARQMFS